MHPDLEKLIVLQAHDVEAKRLRDEMAALPKQVVALEAKAKATQGQRAVIVDLIAKEEVLRRRQESDVKDHQAKIARLRKNMDLATTTVQVTAFEHEIAFAQAEIGRLEDAEIAESALSIYDRIAKAKGTAVAEALNQKCMACQMMVRPQRWNDLRDRNNEETMMSCESCGRLLYYDPARDSPQRKTVPVESIAASIIRQL